MKTNVGTIDRLLRFVVGISLIIWGVRGGPVWAWIGIIPILTASFRFCPAYMPFGISTCGRKG